MNEGKGDAGREKKAGKNDGQAAGKERQEGAAGESGAGDEDIMKYFKKKFEIKE